MSYDYKGLHSFTYNDLNSSELGVYIKKQEGTYDSGARNVKKVNVQGKNGTIVIDCGNFENHNVSYDCRVLPKPEKYNGFAEQTNAIKAWLYNDVANYFALTDTYGGEHLATFTAALNFNEVKKGAYDVTITFDCKPKPQTEETE